MENMSARMRRITNDWEQIKKDFAGHRNIIVAPIGPLPPEKYHVTYFINGIYLLPDGRIETLGRHEVEITLHAEYPRYKPICKILTPIWHPNFRDGQICIGDIWGTGESLTDIIINIGDMIQYKSWNSYSPLSAEAAQWAMENRHLFPVGNINLHIADYASAKDEVDIELFEDKGAVIQRDSPESTDTDTVQCVDGEMQTSAAAGNEKQTENDFEISAEELAGIEFIPIAQRMQNVSQPGNAKDKKVNFKTILVKGVMWALIGALLGFGISEFADKNITSDANVAKLAGHPELEQYYEYREKISTAFEEIDSRFQNYCKENDMDPDGNTSMQTWMSSMSLEDQKLVADYIDLSDKEEEALFDAYLEFGGTEDEFGDMIAGITRLGTGLWSAFIALFIGLLLGIGEGVFYGSKEKTVKYALIGAGVSLAVGFFSGYLAQWMYSGMITDRASDFAAAFVRGMGWALMGLGIGVAIGLIKPEKKRMLFCALGGLVGAFIGGFLFNYVCDIIPNDIVARGAAIVIMGILIGVGVGLLEQFSKQAWLKVIRGDFEGKEYLVFAGTTSIGNNGKNTIVLFKDKLVAPHHCDIVLENNRYILTDQGSPLGTVVNGMKIQRHVLKQGDAIAVGNSVLVFNTK